jgi:hypothetical protein
MVGTRRVAHPTKLRYRREIRLYAIAHLRFDDYAFAPG